MSNISETGMRYATEQQEEKRRTLAEMGLSEDEIAFYLSLTEDCPDGDIIHFKMARLEDEDDESYYARYLAAIERGEHIQSDNKRLIAASPVRPAAPNAAPPSRR